MICWRLKKKNKKAKEKEEGDCIKGKRERDRADKPGILSRLVDLRHVAVGLWGFCQRVSMEALAGLVLGVKKPVHVAAW
ncbi:hypothetical protein RJ639_004932 [Escallonia herrerae]|uniref:Uncharacterized protein n=1 Tax=Escallonia herrerae TaxID=1293975 RepID=A0AA89AWZ1_9ASTE|nr:hypothetical protein RJ639_004932 [Escallonia herrerae]